MYKAKEHFKSAKWATAMRILIFNWRDIKNPEAGGAEVHLHEVFRRIAPRAEVTLVSCRFKGCQKSETIDGIKVIRVGNRFLFNFAAFWHFVTRLKDDGFDIIVDDVSKVPLFTPLYVKNPLLAIIHHIHGKTLFKELPFPMALYVYYSERLMPIFYKKTPFVAGSKSTEEELIGMGIPGSNIANIRYAANHDGIASGSKSANPRVTYFGRVKRYKQLDHLIAAFKIVRENIPQAGLVIAGKGDDYVTLERLVKDWHLESSVELVGEVSEEEKVKLLQQAWVFVTTSMKEGWGITVLEANGCGTPAIAYDVPGLRDSIRDGETGLLVPSSDIEGLAEAIIKLLTDAELRERLGRNALDWASSFGWDRSAEEYMTVITGVINGE
ncbi:MAG: glycosyltransferase family 4 protein [Dehalococcoidia bacterium]|nr:glycosyltransferase family 4 protein [Dehalococcoidia bacterium]